MVAQPHPRNDDSEAFIDEDLENDQVLSEEEAWEMFNAEALRTLGISGVEFLRQWDRGEHQPVPDTTEGRRTEALSMLIPFGRPTFA